MNAAQLDATESGAEHRGENGKGDGAVIIPARILGANLT